VTGACLREPSDPIFEVASVGMYWATFDKIPGSSDASFLTDPGIRAESIAGCSPCKGLFTIAVKFVQVEVRSNDRRVRQLAWHMGAIPTVGSVLCDKTSVILCAINEEAS
jgi:hypothetical protein